MKALILYRSYYGNTKQVADFLARQLMSQGHEAMVQDLQQKLPDLATFDLVMVGAPTRMARVTGKATSVVKHLGKKGFAGKPVAVFDTFGPVPVDPEEQAKNRKWFYPGAAGIMHQVAEEQGLRVYPEVLRCEVVAFKGPLKEQQLEKAAAFLKDLLAWLTVK